MKRRSALILLLVSVLSACASMRGVEVGTDKSSTRQVSVTNSRNASISLSYNDGSGVRELGSIGPGLHTVNVVTSSSSVTLVAKTSTGATIGSYPVTFSGTTPSITVR
jgi:predicted small secreted protein